MRPKKIVKQFVESFNNADIDALADLYSQDAVNHQEEFSSDIPPMRK